MTVEGHALLHSLVALRRGTTVVGGGVLVGGRTVLTCAHVVNLALGRDEGAVDWPADTVVVTWPDAGELAQGAAVVDWLDLDKGDLAALELADDPPARSRPATLADEDPAPGRHLSTAGYRAGGGSVSWALVDVVRTGARGFLEAQPVEPGGDVGIGPGFSGCPVQDTGGVVVGLISGALSSGGCLLIPPRLISLFRPEAAPHRDADASTTLRRRFAARSAARRRTGAPIAAPAEASVDAYLDAAAVLHVFDPTRLQPARPAAQGGHLPLLARSAPAVGWRYRSLRSLLPDVRAARLRALGTRDAMRAALAANPAREATDVQKLFESWLAGDRLVPEEMSYAELNNLRQLHEWGLPEVDGLPPADRLQRALARRSAVAAFEHLVDRNFVGRRRELARLHAHLSGPGSRPLLIWGAGGSGKTALVGRFLLETIDAGGPSLPFAYVPFDSASVDVREPFTLLVAVAAQLTSQAGALLGGSTPGFGSLTEAFGRQVARYRDTRGSLTRRAGTYTVRGGRIANLSEAETDLYDAFLELVHGVARLRGLGSTPVLLVFDSFEEVIYRASEDLLGFWGMLAHLQRDVTARIRVLIVGRVLPDTASVGDADPLPVEELARGDAVDLLVRLGVPPGAAGPLAEQVGRSPLALRLAAEVAGAEGLGPDGSLGLGGVHRGLVGDELIRGQLYSRLLNHIHEPEVRSLAHPGMVLRRITPAVIRHVLAPAGGLGSVDDERAGRLFDGLYREQALVRLDHDGSLVYREEVRRPVLKLLAAERPTDVRRLHEYAIAFYAGEPTVRDRAEELYHRMMLREEPAELDRRWSPGVEPYLTFAIDELPPAQRLWLAERTSIQLSAEEYRLADTDSWERLIGRKVAQALRFASPREALTLLHERADRTAESPLFAVEARALLDLRQVVEAGTLLDRALAGLPVVGNPGRRAELLWLRARAANEMGDETTRRVLLEELVAVTRTMVTRLAQVQALAELLDVSTVVPVEVGEFRGRLASALEQLPESEVDGERSLTRLALVRLGPNYPRIDARLAPIVLPDLLYLGTVGQADLAGAAGRAAESLAGVPGHDGLAQGDVRELVDAVLHGLTAALDPGASGDPAPFVDAFLTLLAAEQTSLSAAALAGIDVYREPWELEVSREVQA